MDHGLRTAVAVDAQVHLRLAGRDAAFLGAQRLAGGQIDLHQIVFFQLLLAHGRGRDEDAAFQPHGDIALIGVDEGAAAEQFGGAQTLPRLLRAFLFGHW